MSEAVTVDAISAIQNRPKCFGMLGDYPSLVREGRAPAPPGADAQWLGIATEQCAFVERSFLHRRRTRTTTAEYIAKSPSPKSTVDSCEYQGKRMFSVKRELCYTAAATQLAQRLIKGFRVAWKGCRGMTNLGTDGSVEFRFFRARARHVSLAGDFNEWSEQVPMRRDGNDGWWVLELKLAPGDYRFRYVADGTWYTDFASNGVEATKTGWNSMLVVPASNDVRPPKFEGDIQLRAEDATGLKVA